jgi:hypothetical protein
MHRRCPDNDLTNGYKSCLTHPVDYKGKPLDTIILEARAIELWGKLIIGKEGVCSQGECTGEEQSSMQCSKCSGAWENPEPLNMFAEIRMWGDKTHPSIVMVQNAYMTNKVEVVLSCWKLVPQ